MTSITVQRPTKVAPPRFSAVAAGWFVRLLAWVEKTQSARAERHTALNRTAEAASVRAYALQHAQHDPRFVADLLAAADRHERQG